MSDDDFEFSDHDLDDLPANTIEQFEAAAILATQQQQRTQHTASESDYGLDDGDEVINLDDEEGFVQVQQGRAPKPHATHHSYDAYEEGTTIDEGSIFPQTQLIEAPRQSQADPEQLLSRIKKLEQDKVRERREAENLKTKLQTKSGEADTLRRRHDAEQRKHERQLADQQQHHGDELARLRAEIEALRHEKEQAATDSMFKQHDVRDAVLGARTRKPMPARPKAGKTRSPAGTPQKRIRGVLGDGFNSDDVVMASPSRTRERQRTVTPSLAGKRKRNVVDASPIPLHLSEPSSQSGEKEEGAETDTEEDADVKAAEEEARLEAEALSKYFRKDDRRFDLLHRLMDHTSPNGDDRVLEALALLSFPSAPSLRLSSIFFDAIAAKTFEDVHTLALDICHTICNIWTQCLIERYYDPVDLLVDALHFILARERSETACKIKARFVPLMIDTIDLVANPLSKAAKAGPEAIKELYSSGHRAITSQIDVLECLDLLYLIATSCVGIEGTEPNELWESIPSDFTLMLLNQEQPIAQIQLMLDILATSGLTTSIGPILSSSSQADSQANREDALIGRLTNIFTETPTLTADPAFAAPPGTITEKDHLALRLQVINLLTVLSVPQHGATRLAENPICIGRLIKYLDRLLNSLYKTPLAPTQDITIASVNATMRLIHHIVTSNPGFDIKSKLVNTLGGQHAFLVSLTRLAFSEGLVLEKGIEDEVVDMAHGILDEGLSLEEGEAFGGVFSTGNSVV
ncbi:hypothetical protein E8E13_002371 [Curvularia kusanoi]|uniref:DNA repair protein Rad26 n=1 Tax=Curvularia kusanoi TaxID=90978 RepID=A0A9P4T9Y4_CURKU|nr:hypothetical protein E8E13_002371 [Curvularia kusanoi]